MKISNIQIEQIARTVLNALKEKQQITYKTSEDKVYQRAVSLIEADFDREKDLDQEVNKMMDALEQQNADFERYKMFPMLKKRLAKEKGIVL